MGKRRHQKKTHALPKPSIEKRSRRWRYSGLAIFLGSFALLFGRTLHRGAAPREGALAGDNLLFVTVDTLRADRLGGYGSTAKLTPHLDRLASEGIVFERTLAHVPVTLPAHSSIFTSRIPPHHGVHDNGTFRLDSSQTTLASILKNEGYDTAAFVGAFVLDARFGLNQGFDIYDDFYGEKKSFLSFVELERKASLVIAPAVRWILERGDSPWFAWVHLFDPHAPYEAPARFSRRHPGDAYGAEVAYVDEEIGELLRSLSDAGRLDDTLVVVLGDHGESLGEHGERTHGTFAYDTTLRVPFVLWAKDVLKPGRFSRTVRHVDVMPTVLDLLGVEPPGDIDGRTLRPFLADESRYEPAPSYFEALNPHLTRDWAPLRGVVQNGVKFIDLPIPELYDLADDPSETHNLYRNRARLAAELRAWVRDAASQGPLQAETPDKETLERLESLGYIVSPAAERRSRYGVEDDPKKLVAVANAQDEASTLFAQGQREEAITLLRELLEKAPRSSFGYQKLAYALRQTGRLGEAIHVLERALQNGVHEMSLEALLGSYLLESGDLSRAEGLLEDLTRRHPDFAEGHNYLGVAYARQGRFDEARQELETVLKLDPSSASAYNNLGSATLSAGHVGAAVAYFQQALKYDPRLASAYNGLGVAHAKGGDVDAAIESFERAVELSPAAFDALYNLALALSDKDAQAAIPVLERFIRNAPRDRYRQDVEDARGLLARLRAP